MSPKIGLKRGTVELVEHDPAWRHEFQIERDRLSKAMGHYEVLIEHIGSTAILNVPSKPVIDIAMAVTKHGDLNLVKQDLRALGYRYRGEPNKKGVHLFALGSESSRTHYLHVMAREHPKWDLYLQFRNRWIESAEDSQEYAALKISLARRFAHDRAAYTRGKARFIGAILERENRQKTK